MLANYVPMNTNSYISYLSLPFVTGNQAFKLSKCILNNFHLCLCVSNIFVSIYSAK